LSNPRYTAIFLLVDRSGSMVSIQKSAEDAINEFINGQKSAEGLRTITIAQFDHEFTYTEPGLRRPVTVKKFQIWPRGMTSLLDAMGRGITEFGARLASLPEDKRPGNVVFAVMTDGQENSSTEFTHDQIKAMVEHQEQNYAWQVLYLGANQDAIAEAARLGINRNRAVTYSSTDNGTRSVLNTMDSYVTAAASGGSYTASSLDRENAAKP